MTAVYDPRVFAVSNLKQARQTILTAEDGLTSEERWQRETPYLLGLINSHVSLTPESVVLDWGCGVGRLPKTLIEHHGCWAVGADISGRMLQLAPGYVRSPRFIACHPDGLQLMRGGFDLALAVWVLQHAPSPKEDIGHIARLLRPGGHLFVVNERRRVVPTDRGWVDDGIDVRDLLNAHLKARRVDELDPGIVTRAVSARTFWGVWQR